MDIYENEEHQTLDSSLQNDGISVNELISCACNWQSWHLAPWINYLRYEPFLHQSCWMMHTMLRDPKGVEKVNVLWEWRPFSNPVNPRQPLPYFDMELDEWPAIPMESEEKNILRQMFLKAKTHSIYPVGEQRCNGQVWGVNVPEVWVPSSYSMPQPNLNNSTWCHVENTS